MKYRYNVDYLDKTKFINKNYFRNKEQQRVYQRYDQRRRDAEKKGIEFTIKLSDLAYPEICPLLNIPIHYHSSDSRNNWPSIDRINNTKGYTPDNVWIISNRANRLKSDSTPGELMKLALNLQKKIKEIRNSPNINE